VGIKPSAYLRPILAYSVLLGGLSTGCFSQAPFPNLFLLLLSVKDDHVDRVLAMGTKQQSLLRVLKASAVRFASSFLVVGRQLRWIAVSAHRRP
jgi:hypothetical protein